MDSFASVWALGLRIQYPLIQLKCDSLAQRSFSPRYVSVWQHLKLSDISLETRPRDSLDAERDVKKPTNQTKQRYDSSSSSHNHGPKVTDRKNGQLDTAQQIIPPKTDPTVHLVYLTLVFHTHPKAGHRRALGYFEYKRICISLQVKSNFRKMTLYIFLKVLKAVTVSDLSRKRIPNIRSIILYLQKERSP